MMTVDRTHHQPAVPVRPSVRIGRGFSLIELMIAVSISLIILAGLGMMLSNLSKANTQLAKVNSQIENGRFAVQILQSDVAHAGFWGLFTPQFDDKNWPNVPNDAPSAVPDPCLAFASWDFTYRNNIIGIPVQALDTAPGTCGTSFITNQQTNTDVLVVRHAGLCIIGSTNCSADVAGNLYFQASQCGTGAAGRAQSSASANTIRLGGPGANNPSSTRNPTNTMTSSVNNFYAGMVIYLTSGTGAGQQKRIISYDGTSLTATVDSNWTTIPDATTEYVIVEDILDTTGLNLHQSGANCATAATANKRSFVSNIYYIRNYLTSPGDKTPTLVRVSLDPVTQTYLPAAALVDGIENMRVELGLDSMMTRCTPNAAPDYTQAVSLVDHTNATCTANTTTPDLNTLPKNRGDGDPDGYKRCTGASPCSLGDLTNTVAVKLFLLARASQPTAGYTDTKTYCLGSTDSTTGNCPSGSIVGPFNDSFERHVFSTTIRLSDVSGRRETM